MNVQAAMQFLGEHDGVKWYWAEPGHFINPGVYYWDGEKNVRVDLPSRGSPLSMNDGDGLVIAGIHPTTKACVLVAMDTPDNWAEARQNGLIIVPVTKETAREIWGQEILDLYAIAAVKS